MTQAIEVGTQLVTLFNEGKFEDCINHLYGDNVISIEGQGSDEMPARMEGIDAIRGKNEWWFSNNEVHEVKATGPFAGHREDQFVVHFYMDITPVGGERTQMNEVGLYTLTQGKIGQEEFLYLMA